MDQDASKEKPTTKINPFPIHYLEQLREYHRKKALGQLNKDQKELNENNEERSPLLYSLYERRKDNQKINMLTQRLFSQSNDKKKKSRGQPNIPLSLVVKNESYIIFFREIFQILGLINQNETEKQFSSLLSKAYENYDQKQRKGEWKQLRKNHKKIEIENKGQSFLDGDRLEKIKKSYLNLIKGYRIQKYNSNKNKIESGQCFLSSDLEFLGCKLEGKEDFKVYNMKYYKGIKDQIKQTPNGIKITILHLIFTQERKIQIIIENQQKKQEFIQDINNIKICMNNNIIKQSTNILPIL